MNNQFRLGSVARLAQRIVPCLPMLLFTIMIAPPAWAGPNANGTLILHVNEPIVYCQNNSDYCELSGLTSCAAADNSVSGGGNKIFFAIAAFPVGSSPRLSGVTFGIVYTTDGLVAQGSCGDFELSTADWPASGSGTAVTFASRRTTPLTVVYWFAGYNYFSPNPASFALTPHPTQGGWFGDDSVPSILEPIAGYGVLGFDQPGSTPCPVPPPTGACCTADGSCTVMMQRDCQGVYQGDFTVCTPNPCSPGTGACCLADGSCIVTSAIGCSGDYQGNFTSCTPNPCPQPPPVGACCFADGACALTTQDNCGGAFQGIDTPCDPNPCPQPCSGRDAVRWANAPAAQPAPRTWPNGPGERAQGPNAFGTLLLHTNPSLVYTDGVGSFCGLSNLAQCENADTEVDGSDVAVIHVIAAFPAGSQPRLAGIVFGIAYGPCVTIEAWGACADFELATAGWPNSGEGTALTWMAASTTQLTEVYWFAASVADASIDALRLVPHPTQGALFADDSVPAQLDEITDLGWMGFNQAGYRACPMPAPLPGACCFPDGHCVMLRQPACTSDGGTFQGEALPCEPNPCPVLLGACCLPTGDCQPIEAEGCAALGGRWQGNGATCDVVVCPPSGACCLPDLGPCVFGFADDCAAQGGAYQGDNASCDPNPCPVPPPPTGACCLLIGSCIVTTSSDCAEQQGFYFGDGTGCDAQPCFARGACCIDTTCSILSNGDCAASGGTYMGDGVPCTPDLCGVPCRPTFANRTPHSVSANVGRGEGTVTNLTHRTGCGSLNMNADGTYENGYSWQYGGVVAPTYGAFAECYSTSGLQTICSVVFDLTQVGYQAGQSMDVYAWSDGGNVPGNVFCVRTGAHPGPIAYWPCLSRHTIEVYGCCVDGAFWVGYWGNWPGQLSPWYVGADLDGFGGCPRTNVAPGIGFPTGWTDVSQIWGPTQAIGIGCELTNCGATAVQKLSWGRVKALYHREGEERP